MFATSAFVLSFFASFATTSPVFFKSDAEEKFKEKARIFFEQMKLNFLPLNSTQHFTPSDDWLESSLYHKYTV